MSNMVKAPAIFLLHLSIHYGKTIAWIAENIASASCME